MWISLKDHYGPNLKELLKSFNFWEPDEKASRGIKRTTYLRELGAFTKSDSMILISGQRRAGKSYLVRQYIDQLHSEGVDRRHILYINLFLDEFKAFCDASAFKALLVAWQKQIATTKPQRYFLLIDEVAELEGWQKIIASLLEHPKFSYKIILTGSNSQLLVDDLPTQLRGRYYNCFVYPFDFKEFCIAKQLDKDLLDSFQDYLATGGMPEVVLADDPHARANLLANIRHSTVKKDVIDRYNAHPELLERLVEYTRQTYGTVTTIKRLTEHLKAAGLKVHETLVKDHLSWLQNVYWVTSSPVFSARTSDTLRRAEHKYYLGDHGFAFDIRNNLGRLLENVIFNELRAAQFLPQTFHGYHEGKKFEIDFVATKGRRTLFIQVAWEIGDPIKNHSIFEREFGNFAKLGHRQGEKIVVTMDPSLIDEPGIIHLGPLQFLRHLRP